MGLRIERPAKTHLTLGFPANVSFLHLVFLACVFLFFLFFFFKACLRTGVPNKWRIFYCRLDEFLDFICSCGSQLYVAAQIVASCVPWSRLSVCVCVCGSSQLRQRAPSCLSRLRADNCPCSQLQGYFTIARFQTRAPLFFQFSFARRSPSKHTTRMTCMGQLDK